MRFADRRHAGRDLAGAVSELGPTDPVVYALPRGGVPVGFEVARALGCPLDVLIVRKLGVPRQPELAMGALAEGGLLVRDERVISLAGVSEDEFDRIVAAEEIELSRRVREYRGKSAAVPATGKTAVLVDDGLATGASALVAAKVIRERGPSSVWLAVPVAPRGGLGELEEVVDIMVILSRPRNFLAVGAWYRDFDQTSDSEVEDLLARARLP